MTEKTYCEDCIYYPSCPDLDEDTEVFECDYHILFKPLNS